MISPVRLFFPSSEKHPSLALHFCWREIEGSDRQREGGREWRSSRDSSGRRFTPSTDPAARRRLHCPGSLRTNEGRRAGRETLTHARDASRPAGRWVGNPMGRQWDTTRDLRNQATSPSVRRVSCAHASFTEAGGQGSQAIRDCRRRRRARDRPSRTPSERR